MRPPKRPKWFAFLLAMAGLLLVYGAVDLFVQTAEASALLGWWVYLSLQCCGVRNGSEASERNRTLRRPPELREYKCVYVLNDEEIGLFSDEVVVNCAP